MHGRTRDSTHPERRLGWGERKHERMKCFNEMSWRDNIGENRREPGTKCHAEFILTIYCT